MNTDRRDFSELALKWFPSLEKATSDEWHFFLDKVTGLDTPLDMPNGSAFDRWRQALAEQGYPAWDYATSSESAKAKAASMLEAEQRRAASLGKTLEALAKEAPNWTVAEMLSSAKG